MIRRTALWVAVALPGLAILIVLVNSTDPDSAKSLVERWQTLIAGALAILAAVITAKPVWKQLERMELQSTVLFREYLSEKVASVTKARDEMKKAVDDATHNFMLTVYEIEEGGLDVDIGWAFHSQQVMEQLRHKLIDHIEITREPESIRLAIADFVEATSVLIDALDSIHRPHSMDHVGEDYEIPDVEWEEMKRRGEANAEHIGEVAWPVSRTARAIQTSYEDHLQSLRDRLAEADARLLRSKL